MKRHELRQVISEGENSRVEFKRRFTSPEKIAKELCAFANTHGGYLLLGVDDDGKIVGVESEKEQVEQILLAAQFYIEPPLTVEIEIVEIEWKDVVVVHIPPSPHRPHWVVEQTRNSRRRGTVYVRSRSESVQASREMVRLMREQRPDSPPLRLYIGERERRLFEYLEKNGSITVAEFARLVNISRRRALQVLIRLVRAQVLVLHSDAPTNYFTLVEDPGNVMP
ncbi:MAG: putative DNA binding domain-containing protein [Bacteroidota bacterium]|nr:putative DNA binding domain-containing protein [Candidatus Kapabacteria bacterium]MCS7302465.1 putative DNA binding domain-containing protein [Candidatus Kapabacteria bacterium]MCX7936355.1 putative DNA binding domain-containing protein [Chlorobiota bacterium]MDW8074364.1 putative DNA binding domain-containing protein [Bacteroidota bacterium]MDW8271160.1 putative DNA binding domain-containing protein [Bacteroidota bacterium]